MSSQPPASAAANASRKSGWRAVLFRPRVVLILLIVGGVPLLRHFSEKADVRLAQQAEYQIERSAIVLGDRPEYVPEELLERTWERAGLPERFSVLEPGLAARIGKAFEESPWVRSVKRVQLRYPTVVEIELEYRRPVALVRSIEGYYPVDRDGILLPPADFSPAQLPGYPIIENVRSLPSGPAGTHWGDLAVWGAARLVDLLTPEGDTGKYWKKYDLARVRVFGAADLETSTLEHLQQISYRLVTHGGSEIIWGIAPGVDDPTEPNAETKLKRLGLYDRDVGGLNSDQGQGPVEIDLRRWKDIARRPLSLPGDSRTR